MNWTTLSNRPFYSFKEILHKVISFSQDTKTKIFYKNEKGRDKRLTSLKD